LTGAGLLGGASAFWQAGGFALLYLYHLLDKVDGEIARYRRSESLRGVALDYVGHLVVPGTVWLGASLAIARDANPIVSVVGAMAAFATVLVRVVPDI